MSSCLSEVMAKDFQKLPQERRVDIKIRGLVRHGSKQWRKIRHTLVATMTQVKAPSKNLLDLPKYENRKNFQKELLGCVLVSVCTPEIV